MTARTKVTRALRRVTKAGDAPTMDLEIEHVISQLDQLIRAAGPEDRIDVLRSEGYETFERLLDHGMTNSDARTCLFGFADRHDLWGTDRANEAEIVEVIRDMTDVSELDGVPFEEDVRMAEPCDELSADQASVLPPLTLSEWDDRDLKNPDFLLGALLSTTSRMLISAPTGLGKTNLAIAIGLRVSAGMPFLHWLGSGRRRRVLYIDGEMSKRLLRLRLRAEAERLGTSPTSFFALSAEDVDDFKPLNTEQGRAYLWHLIERLGGVDLAIFDNIQSLISGSMVDEVPWAEVLPLVRSLTQRNAGQIWIHHTGHNEGRSYGTKTREWQMDTVAILEQNKRPDTDVSFKMSFSKARERAPSNRNDFREVEIALVDDAWAFKTEFDVDASPAKKVSPAAEKYLDALKQAVSANAGQPVDNQAWAAACGRAGLVDLEGKRNIVRAQLSKYRGQLVAAGMVGTEGDRSWPID